MRAEFLFKKSLPRVKNVCFFFNFREQVLGSGEVSVPVFLAVPLLKVLWCDICLYRTQIRD